MPNSSTTSTDLAAQAKKLGLGVSELTPAIIAESPTDILPIAVIEARGIFPYKFDAATNTLHVAVAKPDELKKPAPAELQAQRTSGKKLMLELVDPTEFTTLLPKIRDRFPSAVSPKISEMPKPTTAPTTPMVDLNAVKIPRNVLLKLPEDVASKFRVIVYEAAADGTSVKIASDKPTDAGVLRVVKVIRDKRGVTATIARVESAQLDSVLAAYATNDDPIAIAPKSVKTTVPIVSEPSVKPVTPADNSSMPVPAVATPPLKRALPTLPQSDQSLPKPAPTPVSKPNLPASLPPLPPLPTPVATVSKPATPSVLIPVKKQPDSAHSTPSVSPAAAPLSSPKPVAETMPIDTSKATTSFDESKPAKITLAAPIPSSSTGPSFPMPKLSGAARTYLSQTGAGIPSAPLPAVPLVAPPSAVVSTPKPLPAATSSITPQAAAPQTPPLGTPPIQIKAVPTAAPTLTPLNVTGSTVEVQKSEVANTSAFASLQTISPTDDQQLDQIVGSTIRSADELETVVRTGLVPKILAAILQYAVNVGASDIHVEATEDSLRIRFRVDGVLQDMLKAPLGLDAPFVSRVKILSGMKIDEQRVPQDGRFTAVTGNREVDFRVSTLPAIHGEKVVMRILDKSIGVRSIDQLGFDAAASERVAKAIAKPYGIILVTGPTGSGKTTTLYAMLGTLNQPGVNIITLEDPVEYELAGITQTQVKPKIGFSFAEGLRSVLRQDPDIVMVGEIRDRETASLATHAALTGHLVLSTLHTNTAAGAIPRFLNMGVEAFLVASSIDAVIGQRLVRKLCDKCKQPATISEAIHKDVADVLAGSPVPEVKQAATAQMQFFAPHGCDECHSGYRGRLGIYEVMTVSPEIEALAANKSTVTDIQKIAEQQGMVTMKQDGILKALQGLTSLDEVLRVTTE